MMDKKEFFDKIHGQMIISCQAVEGEPLYVEEKSVMYLMARAAKMAGTPSIRTSSIRDVVAIKEETGLPVIGLVKIQYPGYEGYITPTMKEVDDLVAVGSDVVALDCTMRKRGDGKTINQFIQEIRERHGDIVLMADISNYEEGINAWKCGVDIVGTTMSGYTEVRPAGLRADAPPGRGCGHPGDRRGQDPCAGAGREGPGDRSVVHRRGGRHHETP